MNNLFISHDNVNWQAQGVLACLRSYDGLENSWDTEQSRYLAEPEVNAWFNGRERGYVVTLRSEDYRRQFHIAFFEHRNSDIICAVCFETSGLINPPTINDIPKSHPFYESKWDYDFSVGCGKFIEMADWIIDKLEEFWDSSSNKTTSTN